MIRQGGRHLPLFGTCIRIATFHDARLASYPYLFFSQNWFLNAITCGMYYNDSTQKTPDLKADVSAGSTPADAASPSPGRASESDGDGHL